MVLASPMKRLFDPQRVKGYDNCCFGVVVVEYSPRSLAYLVLGSWPPEQCQRWAPSRGVALTPLVSYLHNIYATIAPAHLPTRLPL